MTCPEMDRWLDDGMPASGVADAGRHAGGCPSCAAAWRAARELDGLLAAAASPAPEGMMNRVMARVASATVAHAHAPVPASPLAWWVRAAAEPASALATTLAALLLWQGQAIRGFAVAAANAASRTIMDFAIGGRAWLAPFDQPAVLFGLGCAAMPIVALAVLELFRWSERLTGGEHRAAVRGAAR